VIGLYPKPFYQILQQPVNELVLTVRPDYPGITMPVNASVSATPAQVAALPVTAQTAKVVKP
jgi:hypothetical protein